MTRTAVIIGDVLVLLVTWSKTVQLYRDSRRLGIKAPLATLLFRDGRLTLALPSLLRPESFVQEHFTSCKLAPFLRQIHLIPSR